MRNATFEGIAGSPSRLTPDDVDQIVEHLCQSTTVDPGQVPMYRQRRTDSGEKQLLLAILEDALNCSIRHSDSPLPHQRRAAAEATAWIEDDMPIGEGFSFLQICHVFGFDSDWIREQTASRRAHPRARAQAA